EARRFGSSYSQGAAHVVYYQSSQRFAFYVFSNDEERTAGFGDSFQDRHQFADVGDFLLDQEDQRVVEIGSHAFLVVDEVSGEVAAVELHTFYYGEFVL